MAYVYYSNLFSSSVSAWCTNVNNLLSSAGWTSHDVSGGSSGYTIWKSEGTEAAGRFIYVKVPNASTVITLYSNWNATTHTFIGGSGPVLPSLTTVYGGSTSGYMYASLDGFFGWSQNAGTIVGNSPFAVFRPTTYTTNAFYTTTTSAINTGSNVVIPVSSSIAFSPNCRYAIVDAANGKRCPITCTAVSAGSITVSSIASGPYASGSYIGTIPYPIFVYYQSQIYCLGTASPFTAGNMSNSTYASIDRFSTATYYSAYQLSQSYPMVGSPIKSKRIWELDLVDGYTNTSIGGFYTGSCNLAKQSLGHSSGYLDVTTAAVLNDVTAFGEAVSGVSTGSNTSSTLNDTSKSWVVNEWVGYVLVLTAGPESGQIVKILSNTATQLTTTSLAIVPTTNTYIIASSAYRNSLSIFTPSLIGSNILFQEGV